MRFTKRMCIIPTLVGAFFALSAGNALAGNNKVEKAATPSIVDTASSPTTVDAAEKAAKAELDYCGPPVTSVQQMIGYYLLNPKAAKKATEYLRKHAAYYHFQADQTLINYLQQPNIKFKKAPNGYLLWFNTGCDANGNIVKFDGKYAVSELGMLWWCDDPSGEGYDCIPITKGYCRNWVKGKKAFPKPTTTKTATPRTKKCPPPYKGTPPFCKKPGTKPVTKKPAKPVAPICSNINSPGAIACSTFVNVCGIQVPYTGRIEDMQAWINNYIQINCAPAAPPPVTPTPTPPSASFSCDRLQARSTGERMTDNQVWFSVNSGVTKLAVKFTWGDGTSNVYPVAPASGNFTVSHTWPLSAVGIGFIPVTAQLVVNDVEQPVQAGCVTQVQFGTPPPSGGCVVNCGGGSPTCVVNCGGKGNALPATNTNAQGQPTSGGVAGNGTTPNGDSKPKPQ